MPRSPNNGKINKNNNKRNLLFFLLLSLLESFTDMANPAERLLSQNEVYICGELTGTL